MILISAQSSCIAEIDVPEGRKAHGSCCVSPKRRGHGKPGKIISVGDG